MHQNKCKLCYVLIMFWWLFVDFTQNSCGPITLREINKGTESVPFQPCHSQTLATQVRPTQETTREALYQGSFNILWFPVMLTLGLLTRTRTSRWHRQPDKQADTLCSHMPSLYSKMYVTAHKYFVAYVIINEISPTERLKIIRCYVLMLNS